MAHYIFKKLSEEGKLNIDVRSCGTAASPDVPVCDLVKNLLKQEGITNFNHVPTIINKNLTDSSDLIIVMTKEYKLHILKMFPDAEKKVFLLSEYSGSGDADILDPFGQPDESYKQTFDLIKDFVVKLIQKLQSAERGLK